MAISHLSLVNQKLAFASSIITALSTYPDATTAAQKIQRQALGDAAVFHLSMGLHFYVRELAEHHQIKNVGSINSIQDLISTLSEVDKASPESFELVELAELKGCWLNQLTHYYDQLSKSPEKSKEKKAFAQENLIAAVELTEAESQLPVQLTSELLGSWLESFRVLVMRQRETSTEY